MIQIVFLWLCLSVAAQDENVAMHSEFQAAGEQKTNCSQALAYVLQFLHSFQNQANAYSVPISSKLVFSNTNFDSHSSNNLHSYLQINPTSSMHYPWPSAVKSSTASWNAPLPFPKNAFSIFLLNQHKNRNTSATSSNSISAIERHLIVFLKRNFPSIPLESMARFLKLVIALFPVYTSLFSFNTIHALQNNDLLHLFKTYLRNNHQLPQSLHVLHLANTPFANYTIHSSQNSQFHSSSKLGQRQQNPLLVYLINFFQQRGLQLPQFTASSGTSINSHNKLEGYPYDVNDSTAIQTTNNFDFNSSPLSVITNLPSSSNGKTVPFKNFIPFPSNNTLLSIGTDHPISSNRLSNASLRNAPSFPLNMPLPFLLYQLLQLSQSSTLHNTSSNTFSGEISVPYDNSFVLREHPLLDSYEHDQVPMPNASSISSNNLHAGSYVDLPSPLSNAQSDILINNLYPRHSANTHSVQSFVEGNFLTNNYFQRLLDNVHSHVRSDSHSDQSERAFIIKDNPLNYLANNSGEGSSPSRSSCHCFCLPSNVSLDCPLPNSSLVISNDVFSILLRTFMLRYSNFLDFKQSSDIFSSSPVNFPSNPYFKYLYFILQKLKQVQRLYENCKLLSVVPLTATTYEARCSPLIKNVINNDTTPKTATTYEAKDEGKEMPSEDVLYGLSRGEPDENEMDIGERIIGGRVVFPGEVPYQVALYKINVFVCGSSLISPLFVITAGHCLKGVRPEEMWFRVGSDSLLKGGKTYRVHDFVVHEQYINSDYDIALMKSAKTVELGPTVKPIPLPSANDPAVLQHTSVQASGWGATELNNGAPPAYQLHTIHLKTVSKKRCQNRIMKSFRIVTDRQICAIAPVRGGCCFGDSGGPLVSNGKLIGIVSWGSPCAIGDPDVYTNVQKFLPWIYTKMNIFNQNPESPQSYYHNLNSVLDTSDEQIFKTIFNNLIS